MKKEGPRLARGGGFLHSDLPHVCLVIVEPLGGKGDHATGLDMDDLPIHGVP